MENYDLLNNELTITSSIHGYLKESAKWAKFLAIMGFVFAGLMFIISFLLPEMLMQTAGYSQFSSFGSLRIVVTIIYLTMSVLMVVPCLYLFRFATKAKMALTSFDQEELDLSLMNLKSMFKFWGITMIVILGLYALIFLISFITAFL